MDERMFSKKRYYILFATYFLIFSVIVAVLTSLINYNIKYTDIGKLLKSRAVSEIEFNRKYIKDYISHLEKILASIARNEYMADFVKTGSEKDREILNQLFYSLSFANENIMQLRYIDKNGLERVRLDRDKTSPQLIVVPKENMQDKSGRYYFKEASQVMQNTFWHSNIDLNIEHGKIEKPIKPTFRVALPLVIENKPEGMLIVNTLVDSLLDIATSSPNFNIYIFDKEGEVITNPDPEKSWSRYLENKPDIRDIFPVEAQNILTSAEPKVKDMFIYDISDLFSNNEGLKMIFTTKNDIMSTLKRNSILTALFIAFIVLVVSAPLSWIASIIPSRLQSNLVDAYDNIKKFNDIIDKNIITSTADKNGIITDVSSKFVEVTGYSRSDIIGKSHNVLKHPETPEKHYEQMWRTISSGNIWSGEMRDIDKAGNDFWIKQVITPEFSKNGLIKGYTSIAQDVTDKKIIEKMSITDRLTGLYNRHKLDQVLEEEMNRHNRYKSNFCALLLDIDFFKKVNDTYGHQAGDDVLVKLSGILRDITRNTDFAGRWGGEEFLVIAVQINLEKAFALAEKLRTKVEETYFENVGHVTVSIGVAQYEYGETIAHFINRADDALYRAKNEGRNRVVTASSTPKKD